MRLPNTSAVDYLALSKLNCKILIPIEALSYIINHNSHMEGNCYITTQVVKVALLQGGHMDVPPCSQQTDS